MSTLQREHNVSASLVNTAAAPQSCLQSLVLREVHCGEKKSKVFPVGLGKKTCITQTEITEQREGCRVTHLQFPTAAALPETPGKHFSSLADKRKNKEKN